MMRMVERDARDGIAECVELVPAPISARGDLDGVLEALLEIDRARNQMQQLV